MKKTAIVLSVLFLIGGFIGIWVEAYKASAMCFIVALCWILLKVELDKKSSPR